MQHHPDDHRLRVAFLAGAPHPGDECSEQDLDRICKAIAGELPASERRDLVERVAKEPAFAEAWRVARELHDAPSLRPAPRRVHRWRLPPFASLAAAAILVLGFASALAITVHRAGGDVYRDQTMNGVRSALGPEATLPREAFRLRWTPGPSGSWYELRVLTQDLQLVTSATNLSSPDFVVQPGLLTDLPAGARVLWQVDVTLPGGEHRSSETFVARVQ